MFLKIAVSGYISVSYRDLKKADFLVDGYFGQKVLQPGKWHF